MAALDGMKVLDLTQYEAGTTCTQYLAWLGADVVKVERPGVGDPGRNVAGKGRDSYYFLSFNNNKKSVAIALHTPEGRDLFLRLVPKFDVVVENFTLGTMEKLGIGYADMAAVNPSLIFASASMWGPHGPRGHDPGYDTIAQAAGGMMMFHRQGDETPHGIQGGIADQTGGAMLAHAILGALVHRLRTGEGQHVNVSLYGSQIAIQGIHVARALHHTPLRPPGQSSGVLSHRSQCLDGKWIAYGFLEAWH
ncbi:MAG: CoA transferase, partial [Dehalococcoidia bacterium]|nr:CoA transferase [Dehalococcoidia bacterium]